MRIDSALLAGAPVSPQDRARLLETPRRPRFDRWEWGLLLAFGLVSMWVVGLDLFQVIANGRTWTGTDGFFIVDQMQYLAWIQSASHHLLAANLFVLRDTPADYFQPAVAISGVLTALGMASWLTLLLWKPVAVIGLFWALRAYALRVVITPAQRRTVIALGLFFGSFTIVYGAFGVIGDMMPTWLTWGYPFGLIAVALVLVALLGYDRARTQGRVAWAPGLLGAVASTLHPWQGELLILVVVMAEAIRWREHTNWRSLRLPLLTLALTGFPLIYYFALGHADLSWNLARDASRHTFSLWSILLGIAPLGIVAALGYRGRPRDFMELLTRLWPLAALVIWLLSATALSATPLHAFNGITIPLAALAVIGVSRQRWPRMRGRKLVAAAVLIAATVPANVYLMKTAPQYVAPTAGNANFITADEHAAIKYLRHDPTPGGVLTQFYLGEAVPGQTGRKVLVGDCLWSEPNCMPRSLTADALFKGQMSSAQAQQFVSATGARFVLASCKVNTDLSGPLGQMVASVHHFGCATVYDLGQSSDPTGPLAELPSNAAVRASRRQ